MGLKFNHETAVAPFKDYAKIAKYNDVFGFTPSEIDETLPANQFGNQNLGNKKTFSQFTSNNIAGVGTEVSFPVEIPANFLISNIRFNISTCAVLTRWENWRIMVNGVQVRFLQLVNPFTVGTPQDFDTLNDSVTDDITEISMNCQHNVVGADICEATIFIEGYQL